MAILMDDQCVAQRILDHIEHGATDLGQTIWREPVDNYRSKERLAAEVEIAFRRSDCLRARSFTSIVRSMQCSNRLRFER
jgi:hypothetical protein